MKKGKKWLGAIVPLALVAVGIGIVLVLVKTKPTPARESADEREVQVEVIEVEPEQVDVIVEGRGRVVAARRAEMSAHVAGPLAWVSPRLIPGGRFERGEALLQVDQRRYQLASQTLSGEVSQAELALRRERNRAQVSEQAWRRYQRRKAELDGGDSPDSNLGANAGRASAREHDAPAQPSERAGQNEDPALALNRPQLRSARQSLEAAKSRLARAELDVERTRLFAPFDAVVESENVERGQRVSPGPTLVTLVGSDAFWVKTSIPVGKMQHLEIPGVRGAEAGSAARIVYDPGDGAARTERRGTILELQSSLSRDGAMAQLLVRVEDPLGFDDRNKDPLLLGSFVEVALLGNPVDDLFVLPEEALHEGNTVWLAGSDDRLRIELVDVRHRQGGKVLIGGGLEEGDRVVISSLDLPTEGLRLVVERGQPDGGARGELADGGAGGELD